MFGVNFIAQANVLATTELDLGVRVHVHSSFHRILLAKFVYVYKLGVVWVGAIVAVEIPAFLLSVKFLEISRFLIGFPLKLFDHY